jgi:AcrR family transcriptional regulator
LEIFDCGGVTLARASKRLSPAERRDKVIEVTLRLVAHEGIEGTTTARIAAAAGVSEGTLYRMFGSKRGILLAAVDRVHENLHQLIEASRRDDPLEWLQEFGRLHTESMVSSSVDHFKAPLFAFLSAPAHVGLREAMVKGQQRIIDGYVEILESGKPRGLIPQGADVRQAAWMIQAVMYTEDLALLIGMPGFVLEGRSRKALDAILRCFANCNGCPEGVEPGYRPEVPASGAVPETGS